MIFRDFNAVQYTAEDRIGFQFEILSRNGFLEDSVMFEYVGESSGTYSMVAARLPNPKKHLFEIKFPSRIDYRNVRFSIFAKDSSGRVHSSPRHSPEQRHRLSDWFIPPSEGRDSSGAVFILRPNYPNPFRESTWIELEMLQESGVRIEYSTARTENDDFLRPLQKGVRLNGMTEWIRRLVPAECMWPGLLRGQTQILKSFALDEFYGFVLIF
jgi:hypothetical protein